MTKIYSITVYANTLADLKNFFHLFSEYLDELYISNGQRYFVNKIKKHVITLLKSPHVHKTAQEQFERRTYSKKLELHNIEEAGWLFSFKKLKSDLFPEISMVTSVRVCVNTTLELKTNVLNPDNFETYEVIKWKTQKLRKPEGIDTEEQKHTEGRSAKSKKVMSFSKLRRIAEKQKHTEGRSAKSEKVIGFLLLTAAYGETLVKFG